MAQIIQGPGSFGAGLGAGIGQGLNNLLQSKLDQLSQRNQQFQTANALRALNPSWSEQEAQQLSALPTPLLQQALKNIQSQQMGQQEASLLNNLLGSLGQQQPQPNVSQFGGTGQQSVQAAPQEGAIGVQAPKISLPQGAALRPGQALPIANFAAQQQQNVIKNQLAQDKNVRERNKELRDFSKPFIDARRASEKNIKDYDSYIKLANKGNLRSGPTHQLLSKLGIEGFGQNFDTQIASKLTARLAQNAQSAFGPGARITNFLEKTFQQSLPGLWNTNEGIVAISKINKASDQANVVLDDERINLIKETNGNLPYNADDIIRERARPKIEAIETEVMEDIQKSASSGLRLGEPMKSKPSAQSMQGKRIQTPDGAIEKSVLKNGKWVWEKQ